MELCRRHQLANGLELLLIPTKQAPVVAIQSWIRFGAADEDASTAGLAHLFEHLLFKGTEKRGVGQIAREVEGMGGDLNAFTSYDHTVMHLTLGSQYLENGIEILSDAILNSTVDPEETTREKEVVIEEIKRRNDRPAMASADLLRETLFGGHPYSRPVIGYEDVVRNMPRDSIYENYKKYYNCKNLFVVVAGDFEEKTCIDWVEKYFEGLPSGEPTKKRPELASLPAQKVRLKSFDSSNLLMHLSWRGVSSASPELAELDALAYILGQSESSRLIKRLVHEEKLLRSVGSWSWAPRQIGSFDIDMRAAPSSAGKLQKIVDVVFEELEKPISINEIAVAKKNILASALYSKESVDGMAQRFGYFESLTGNWADDIKYHERIQSLNVEGVEEARKKFLSRSDAIFAGIHPKKTKALKPKLRARAKSTTAKKKASKAPKDGVYKFKFQNLTVLVKPLTHLPIFSARWAGLGGLRLESPAQAGIGALWSSSVDTSFLDAAGNSWKREHINKKIDALGGELSAFHGRNSYGYYLDGLSEDLPELFSVLGNVHLRPSFDAKELSTEKQLLLQQIDSLKDNPNSILAQNFHHGLFGNHPFGRSSKGEGKKIKAMRPAALAAYHKKLLSQPQVLSIVGNVDPEHVKELLFSNFSQLRNKSTSPLQKQRKILFPKKDVFIRKTLNKEQSHIMLGFPTGGLKDKSRMELQGLSSVLSGQGGRLFLELRDKLSLCYSVGPTQLLGLDGGYYAFYIGTSPEKEETALKAIRSEIEKVCQKDIPASEWKRASRYYIGNYQIEQQSLASQAFGMALDELYGLGYRDYLDFAAQFKKVNPKSIRKVAKQVFSQPEVITIVGPKK